MLSRGRTRWSGALGLLVLLSSCRFSLPEEECNVAIDNRCEGNVARTCSPGLFGPSYYETECGVACVEDGDGRAFCADSSEPSRACLGDVPFACDDSWLPRCRDGYVVGIDCGPCVDTDAGPVCSESREPSPFCDEDLTLACDDGGNVPVCDRGYLVRTVGCVDPLRCAATDEGVKCAFWDQVPALCAGDEASACFRGRLPICLDGELLRFEACECEDAEGTARCLMP